MADTWGNHIKLSLFGESHGPAIGVVVDGLPPGIAIDLDLVAAEMQRRAPGQSELATPRRETDKVEVLSGLYQGRTTGQALCGVIRNQNTNSGDYGPIPRPGHADLAALFKYKGHADLRGGGHFSGRLTAPLVFAGALAKQVLALRGMAIYGRISAVGGVADLTPEPDAAGWQTIVQKPFPVADDTTGNAMRAAILQAKAEGDSVGGIVEVSALGVPPGLGNPFFDSVESVAAHLFFSIPAVKGVEFGGGFSLAAMRGHKANDPIIVEDGTLTTATNHCGGLLGGITTGRPVTARIAFKPTASIAKAQDSVDPATLLPIVLETKGRHDPCIVPRAVPVAEAALALVLLDCLLEGSAP